MCDGNIPFNCDPEICSGKINWKSHVSTDCRDLIQKCLMLDPKKRCSLQDILKHKWMQGPIQNLGPHNLSMKKRPLNGMKTTNPEEQDFEIMQMAHASSPPNAEELLHLEQEKIKHPQHVHPHQKLSTLRDSRKESVSKTSVEEKREAEVDIEKNRPCTSSSQEVEDANEAGENEQGVEEEDNETAILGQEMQKMKADADKLFANNNLDMPLWWKMAIVQALDQDSQNNNPDLLSPTQHKVPGLYYQRHRDGAASDQNLPSAVLYEGAPVIKLEHPSTSFYGEESTINRSSITHKTPS